MPRKRFSVAKISPPKKTPCWLKQTVHCFVKKCSFQTRSVLRYYLIPDCLERLGVNSRDDPSFYWRRYGTVLLFSTGMRSVIRIVSAQPSNVDQVVRLSRYVMRFAGINSRLAPTLPIVSCRSLQSLGRIDESKHSRICVVAGSDSKSSRDLPFARLGLR